MNQPPCQQTNAGRGQGASRGGHGDGRSRNLQYCHVQALQAGTGDKVSTITNPTLVTDNSDAQTQVITDTSNTGSSLDIANNTNTQNNSNWRPQNGSRFGSGAYWNLLTRRILALRTSEDRQGEIFTMQK